MRTIFEGCISSVTENCCNCLQVLHIVTIYVNSFFYNPNLQTKYNTVCSFTLLCNRKSYRPLDPLATPGVWRLYVWGHGRLSVWGHGRFYVWGHDVKLILDQRKINIISINQKVQKACQFQFCTYIGTVPQHFHFLSSRGIIFIDNRKHER